MACITKLATAIAYDCDSGATGLASALIINKADIASFSVDVADYNTVKTLVLAPGATAYKIDTVKRSLVMSEALKVNEGAPNAYTHTANLITMGDRHLGSVIKVASAMPNGSFVILTKPVTANLGASGISVYGLYYGLSATSAERSSHDNGGWYSYTLETPENVIGEDNLYVLTSLYDTLYADAIG